VLHGLSLATITRRWSGETPFMQVSTTWALTCPETVHRRPCRLWQGRSKPGCLSDSRVGNNSVVYHRSRRPVLSPLRNCVDRCHVWPYWASRCMHAVQVDSQRHQRTQANLDGLRWFEAYCQLPLYDVEKEMQHCWALAAMRAAWVADSLKSGALHCEDGCQWDLCSWI